MKSNEYKRERSAGYCLPTGRGGTRVEKGTRDTRSKMKKYIFFNISLISI